MKRKHIQTYGRLVCGGLIDEANDTTVRASLHDRQFTKVLVERDEDAALAMGSLEDLFITRVFSPVARPHDIVAGGTDLSAGTTPDARVQEEFHSRELTTIGSTRS